MSQELRWMPVAKRLDALKKRDEQIVKLRDRGWSLRRIAEKYDITQSRVSQILARERPAQAAQVA